MASATLSLLSSRLYQGCRVRLGQIRSTQVQCWYSSQTGKDKENKSKQTAVKNRSKTTSQSTDKSGSKPATAKTSPEAPAAEKFDNSSYKVPEYYSHNALSFYDIENAMSKFRVPQPSSVKSGK